MRNAGAGGFKMKSPFNINLPSQTGDVIYNPMNPENPDSKPYATAPVISCGECKTLL